MKRVLCILTALALIASPAVAAAADQPDTELYAKFVDTRAPALVTIKCVLKMKSARGEQEMESENTGVMIDPRGIVLCSNTKLSGPIGTLRRLAGSSASGITVTPTDLKVLIGDAVDGLEARFIARDTELDLAWIQIKEPGDRTFAYVDFTKSVQPKPGQIVYSVFRMSKHYDRLAVVSQQRIGAIARKPRDLYIGEDFSSSFGLPAFTAAGEVVGVAVLQVPEEEDESSGQLGMLSRLTNTHEMSGALLPAADVVRATQRAREAPESQPSESQEDEKKPTTQETRKEKAEDKESE